jgi:hypothetical protein
MRLNMTAIAFPQQQISHISLSCMSATEFEVVRYKYEYIDKVSLYLHNFK